MAGYYGFSMSNNAVTAYEEGAKPLSKWTKQAMLECIEECELNCDIKLLKKMPLKLMKEELLEYDGWHHTSIHYNKTEFYSFNYDKVESLDNETIIEMIDSYKEKEEKQKQLEEKENQEIKCRCQYLVWSGSRRHPKATEVESEGVIRKNWFYPDNENIKKSINANGFKILEVYKEKKKESLLEKVAITNKDKDYER